MTEVERLQLQKQEVAGASPASLTRRKADRLKESPPGGVNASGWHGSDPDNSTTASARGPEFPYHKDGFRTTRVRSRVKPRSMSNLEQLRRDGATIKQIAHRTGTSYGALRKQWSVNGWHSPIQHRRTLIAKVIDRGTPSEIAEFLVRYHEVRMTPAAIRAVRNRLKRARG